MSKKRVIMWRDDPNLYPAISTKTTRLDNTGSWRYMRPVYCNITPPCNNGCPAGNNVRGYLELALNGKIEDAGRLILETSPFPSVCGRVCYHPCETVCNRANFDEAIAVHSVERYIGDAIKDIDVPKAKQRKKHRIAIIGAGPAGLSCAYQLARMSFSCTVFESQKQAGGMLYYGIPSYRLPKDVLAWEVERIKRLGVEIKLNTMIDAEAFEECQRDFDAVFVGLGAWGEQKMSIEGEELEGVLSGFTFLNRINAGEKVQPKPRIVVIGGGNTAIDVVRSAKRLGSDPFILYRRTEHEMPAHPDEVKEARDEGIDIRFLAAPKRIIGKNGKVTAVECQKMKLGEPDSSGRRRPVPIEGDTYVVEVDEVYTAIGEKPDLNPVSDILKTKWNRIDRDIEGKTSIEGVFCGGDAGVNTKGTVVNAIGEGRRAAYAIEAYLQNQPSRFQVNTTAEATYESLNTDYFIKTPRVIPNHLSPDERSDFREVVATLDQQKVVDETSRCFSCGVCNHCLNCLTFCPDSAIKEFDDYFEIDLNYCKGCGVCVEECPRNAMYLEEER